MTGASGRLRSWTFHRVRSGSESVPRVCAPQGTSSAVAVPKIRIANCLDMKAPLIGQREILTGSGRLLEECPAELDLFTRRFISYPHGPGAQCIQARRSRERPECGARPTRLVLPAMPR